MDGGAEEEQLGIFPDEIGDDRVGDVEVRAVFEVGLAELVVNLVEGQENAGIDHLGRFGHADDVFFGSGQVEFGQPVSRDETECFVCDGAGEFLGPIAGIALVGVARRAEVNMDVEAIERHRPLSSFTTGSSKYVT